MSSIKDTAKKEITCLVGPCRLVRHEVQFTYNKEADYTVLWCSLKGKAVVDVEVCPDGKWEKDSKGYPNKTDETLEVL